MDALPVLPMGLVLAMKVLIALNSAWNLLNFRGNLIKSLIADGHTVILIAPVDEYVPALQALGAKFVELPMRAHGINPLTDLLLLWHFVLVLKRECPDVLLGYTIKPNVYGSLAANLLGIPVVNNIAGLGSAFIKGGCLRRIIQLLYRIALGRSKLVFFQNPDDLQLFLRLNLINFSQAALLPGSGVDIKKFQQSPLPCLQSTSEYVCMEKRNFVFLLVSRMLKDKGVEEYVRAARILKKHYPQVTWALLGSIDQANPNAIDPKKIDLWIEEGIVSYWGTSNDVRLQLTKADCVVLPSYREGTPRTLLEAAAMGRPLIATNVPGCREVVIDSMNGFLCLPRDANDLAKKMKQMLSISDSKLQYMSGASRKLVEDRFDEQLVIEKYRTVLNELFGNSANQI